MLAIVASLAACTSPLALEEESAELVGPVSLELSDHRVVLTPGGGATIRIGILRSDDSSHPVQLQLIGVTGEVEATLSDHNTDADSVTLALAAPPSAAAQEVSFTLRGKLGPFDDLEPVAVSVQIPTTAEPGVEEYMPGVTGEIKSITVGGEVITYEVINGVAVTHGDLVLGDAAGLEARAALRSGTCNFGFHTEFACSSWSDGVIGYSFANNWGSDAENLRMRTIIEDAIAQWETHTGIRFVRRSFGEYLEFRDGSGCSSTVGRAVITGFDSQSISLDNTGCDSLGTAMHEIGHAIGLYHEQSRNDRDDHVVVDFGRVRDGKLHNFFQWGAGLIDRGDYDYTSIMHYQPWAFARDRPACKAGLAAVPPDLSECTVRPTDPAFNNIAGQRAFLSEGDILGAYSLYPPEFTIEGASPGETNYRFFFSLDFDTPRPRADRVVWTSNLAAAPLGTGHSLALRASDVPPGPQVITASFIVADLVVTSRSIPVTLANATPAVSLVATNGATSQHLFQLFTVAATVSDAENGSCPSEVCRYVWTPAPETGPTDTRTATFRFDTEGPHEITVTVEDLGGAVGTGSLTVDIVNTAPTATIVRPTSDIVISDGVQVDLEGRPHDINSFLGCGALQWSSSNPADTFSYGPGRCTPVVSFSGPGTRTISLVATDPQGNVSVPDTIAVTVSACSGNCAPSAFFSLSEPAAAPSIYYIEQPMLIRVRLGDVEAPAHNPITYRLTARRAGEPMVVIAEGSFNVPDATHLIPVAVSWTPADDLASWPLCSGSTSYRDYEIVLEATDSLGATSSHALDITLGCNFI